VTAAESAETPRWVWALALVAGAYLVYLFVTSLAQSDSAESAGYVVGFLIGALVIAFAARFAYVRLRSDAGPLLSPWIVVIAAVVVLVIRLANLAGA
jgi:hypothetical protein